MANLTVTRRINAPIDRVFAVASDLPRAAEHIEGIDKIEMLTDLPVGVGTQWKETRTMFGRSATETFEMTEFDPPNSYRLEVESCGCRMGTTFRFAPVPTSDGNATDLTLELKTQAVSLFAKVMSPLSSMMMSGCKKAIEQDLADIQRVAEAAA